MGQLPNIELRIEDLPRPVPREDPARPWSPMRPGELNSPGDVPWGGQYGTPGPDTGYVLKLAAGRTYQLGDGERRADVDRAVGALAGARASHFGRAPITADLEVAEIVLGLSPEGVPAAVIDALASDRRDWTSNLAHNPHRAGRLVEAVPVPVLALAPAEARSRMAANGRLIQL